jgi:HTH-type transcriptional regulator/antitoxin HigA
MATKSAKKPIRPLRNGAEHKAALAEIERYFEREPKPGTPAAVRFNMLARAIENYERTRWPIDIGRGSPGQARR